MANESHQAMQSVPDMPESRFIVYAFKRRFLHEHRIGDLGDCMQWSMAFTPMMLEF
jgi:hypothetical protein